MKTEEPQPRGEDVRNSSTNSTEPHHDASGPAAKNGSSSPFSAEAAAEVLGGGTFGAPPPVPVRSRILRLVYWTVWFAVAPVVLSCAAIWLLSPASGVEPSGVLAWAQSAIRSQPVPVGIVLFTVCEILLWAFRHELPFAVHAHPPLRAGVPPYLRASLERAQSLIDEAEAIFTRHDKAVVRHLTAKERERVRDEMRALAREIDRVPFDERAFGEALTRAAGEAEHRLARWRKSEAREYIEAIGMAVAVAFALRAFVIEAFKIPSGSMIPTLMVGDHIFVNKFSYGPAIPFTHARVWTDMPPKRGDVMVFAFPEHPEQDFIKRVIAVEGDTLEARGGHPIVNGWPVPSCLVGAWSYSDDEMPARHEGDLYVEYLGKESFLTFYDRLGMPSETQGPFIAKKGEVWVMGDNRNNSHDSRMWFGGQGGGVPFENIRGRALFVWLSFSDRIDWSRELVPVMGVPRLPPSAVSLTPQFTQCLKNRPSSTDPPSRPAAN